MSISSQLFRVSKTTCFVPMTVPVRDGRAIGRELPGGEVPGPAPHASSVRNAKNQTEWRILL
jgi:hypothetical protein